MVKFLFATFATIALCAQAQAVVIIDNFDDALPPPPIVSDTNNPTATITQSASGTTPTILGGSRDSSFTFVPAGNGTGYITFDGDTATTQYTLAGSSANVAIAYDGVGVGGAAAGLTGSDKVLNGSGETGFILSADWNPNGSGLGTPLLLSISVNGIAKTVAIPDTMAVSPPPTYYIPFAYWGALVDFGNVTSVVLGFHLNPTDNATFGYFGTGEEGPELAPLVPEPASVALAVMGLVGFGGYARRRMKARA